MSLEALRVLGGWILILDLGCSQPHGDKLPVVSHLDGCQSCKPFYMTSERIKNPDGSHQFTGETMIGSLCRTAGRWPAAPWMDMYIIIIIII